MITKGEVSPDIESLMHPEQGQWDCSPLALAQGCGGIAFPGSDERLGDIEASAASVASNLNNDRFIAHKSLKG